MKVPPPAGVRDNDWRSLAVAPVEIFEPEIPVTVVVPYYEAPEALALTLAGLEGQSYPRELFEVVVVDDGSDPPLELAGPSPLQVSVIHQPDLGFGLARARNNGARAARGRILAFLDCDMVPETDWLASHARWHHAAGDLLSLGFRCHVDVADIDSAAVRDRPGSLADLFEGRPVQRPEWIERRMSLTDDLASDADDVFRVVTGGNFAVSADFFWAAGGFDESFTQWGSEDIEFGWRAYALGAVLVPERSALCWHQGEGAVLNETEEVSLQQQKDKLSHLIPDRRLRSSPPGRSYSVPQFVVTVEPGHVDTEEVLATVEKVLASSVHDLVVWVEERPAEPFDRLRRLLDPDPRVRVGASGGALEAWPAAAFHVRVPAGAGVRDRMLYRLHNQLGTATAGASDLASGHRVSIARTWALQRARRCGCAVSDVGTIVELDVDSLQVTHEPKPQSWLAARLQGPVKLLLRASARVRRHVPTLFGMVRSIRSPRDLGRFIVTVARAVGWRLRNAGWALRRVWLASRRGWLASKWGWWASRRAWFRTRKLGRAVVRAQRVQRRQARKRLKIWLGLQAKSERYVQRLARYPLGAEIAAAGRDASAVFAASTRVASRLGDDHVDLLVVDSPRTGAATGESGDVLKPAVAVLSELPPRLSVQAFNPEAVNPSGWSAQCQPDSVPLKSLMSLSASAVLSLQIGGELLAELRSLHHIDDRASFHRSPAHRAAALAALAGAGVLVHIEEPDPALAERLGAGLHDLMASDAVVGAGEHEREQISIAMRRCALRDHSLRGRARQLLAASGIEVPVPEVSVLAPTRRPDKLEDLLATVGAQTYPRLELVLGLHGDGWGADSEIAALAESFTPALSIVRVDGALPLGSVLNATAAAASGSLITKMDDDDYYGAEHVWDLVLAHEYSRAELVGKSAEYVYLEQIDQTVRDRQRQKFSEQYIPFIGVSGGVLMISRHDFEQAGGWRRVPRRVDIALAQDVAALGGRIYWTHGAGYLRVRHGDEHTWTVDDSHFLGRASDVRDGCDFAFAGIAEPGVASSMSALEAEGQVS